MMEKYVTIFPLNEFKQLETPFYFYDMELLRLTLDAIEREVPADDTVFKVHYAIKANFNPEIVKYIAGRGYGADCVSGGEIKKALDAGIPANKIVYAGVGKTDREIAFAIDLGIECFNVESEAELEVIDQIAAERNAIARVALRVNPNIDAHTHHYITTGLEENKFGINLEHLDRVVARCSELEHVKLIGLHFHIGSQILTMEPFVLLCERINSLVAGLNAQGIELELINVGGGLGIDYDEPDHNPISDFKKYFQAFRNNLKLTPGQTVHFELGRSVVAQCGSLISRVLYIKNGTSRDYAIIDAGMSDLIRPALYDARHLIQNLSAPAAPEYNYEVVGPICESSDSFGRDIRLPKLKRGDIVAIRSAGAYGEAMSSHYNCRTLHQAQFSTIK